MAATSDGQSPLVGAIALSEPIVPNEETKTSRQKRRPNRQRQWRARRREKKALLEMEAKEKEPSDQELCSTTTPSDAEEPFTPVMSKRKQRQAKQARRKKEELKKIQDAADQAAEINEKARDSGEQESKQPPMKKSSTQASGNTGSGFNKFNPTSSVGCVAALLESLAAVIGSGHTGAWTNGPPDQGNGAGHWKPWTKWAKKK